MSELTLQSLYKIQLKNRQNSSPLFLQVEKWLNNETVDVDAIIEDFLQKDILSLKEKTTAQWKNLLSMSLLNYLVDSKDKNLPGIVRQFELMPWDQSSQYFRLYAALNHFLVQLPIPEVGISLLQSGAALIDAKEYSPWLSLPYHPQHLEFGILLSLLGIFLKRSDIEENVLRLATWQMNTLDYQILPVSSLYVREKENNQCELIVLHYLLFKSAAFYTKRNEFQYLSDVLSKHLQEKFDSSVTTIDPLWVIIEHFLNLPKGQAKPIHLSNQIHDSSTSLVGYRSDHQTAICTLHGCQTGLGYLREKDVEIMNYGPQYFPLDDCAGFGIEGNHLSDHGIRQPLMESNKIDFSIKGCVRLVDQPRRLGAKSDSFQNIWLEVLQEYKNLQMNLKTSVLSLDEWNEVAFCFFVKAEECVVNQNLHLLPGNLNSYEGKVVPIRLQGIKGALDLTAANHKCTMQVIPLGRKNSFWGANFLIAYSFVTEDRNYDWSIKPVATPSIL